MLAAAFFGVIVACELKKSRGKYPFMRVSAHTWKPWKPLAVWKHLNARWKRILTMSLSWLKVQLHVWGEILIVQVVFQSEKLVCVCVCFHCFCVLAYVHVQSYTLFVWLIHQPLSDTGDKLKGISSPGYILITVSWNTWENYISLLQWSMDDKGNDGVLCAKDRKGWIQEALSMRADDRRDVGGFCGVTLQGPISVL